MLSLLGGGRVEVTLGIGYRPHEYAMFGVDRADRRRLLEEAVDVLAAAWRGDAFDYDGRRVLVRPLPDDGAAPHVHLGGSTERAAREAARAGLGLPARRARAVGRLRRRARPPRAARARTGRRSAARRSCSSPTIPTATSPASLPTCSTRRTPTPSGRSSAAPAARSTGRCPTRPSWRRGASTS